MNISPTFIAHAEPPKPMQPSERALHHPSPAAEALTRINPRAGDPTENVARAEERLILPRAIRFIGVQLLRPLASAAATPAGDANHEIQHVLEQRAVVHVRGRELDHERDALGLGQQMVLRARLAAIRRIRAGVRSPFFAGTLLESSAARDESSWSASLNRSRSTWWSVYHTPASRQSRSRRQQVMPLPQPISGGSISHGMPLFNTNRIPVSAARSATGAGPRWASAPLAGEGPKSRPRVHHLLTVSTASLRHHQQQRDSAVTAPIAVTAHSLPR